MTRIVLLVVVGVIGGYLSGLFGVGGGIVMVPLLVTLLRFDHRQAAATSLAAIVPTAIAGSAAYFAQGAVELIAAALIGVGGVVGSLIGSRLLRRLSIAWLRWLFLALLVVVALRTLLVVPSRGADIPIDPLHAGGLVLLGLAMGVASGLFGIGGGVIVVPLLMAVFGADDLLAKGTSLAAMIVTALAGTIGNMRAHLVRAHEGAIVGIAAVLASFGGVATAVVLSPVVANVLFAVLIVVSAAQLLVAAIRERRGRPTSPDGPDRVDDPGGGAGQGP